MGRFDNLETAQGATALVQSLFADVKDCFEQHGTVEPVCFLFMTVDPATEEAYEAVKVGRVDGDMSDPMKVQHFESTVRLLVQKSRAIGVLHIFEAAMFEVSSDEMPTDVEALNQLLEVEAIEEPKKVIVATFEHLRTKPMVWRAEIQATPEKPVLGEFEDQECDYSAPDSQFANWLNIWN